MCNVGAYRALLGNIGAYRHDSPLIPPFWAILNYSGFEIVGCFARLFSFLNSPLFGIRMSEIHPLKTKNPTCFPRSDGVFGRGGRIRTDDLRVMSPTSYQTAPPRTMYGCRLCRHWAPLAAKRYFTIPRHHTQVTLKGEHHPSTFAQALAERAHFCQQRLATTQYIVICRIEISRVPRIGHVAGFAHIRKQLAYITHVFGAQDTA